MKKILKWAGIVLVVLIAIGIFFGGDDSTQTANDTSSTSTVENTNSEATEESINNEPQSLEDKINATIVNVIGEKTNTDKESIIEIQVNDHMGTDDPNDKIVVAKLNGDENLTVNMTKEGLWMDTVNLMKKLFNLPEISEVALLWHLPLTDKYGNVEDEVVMKVTFTREIAEKINWENFQRENIPAIAADYFEHPALK